MADTTAPMVIDGRPSGQITTARDRLLAKLAAEVALLLHWNGNHAACQEITALIKEAFAREGSDG